MKYFTIFFCIIVLQLICINMYAQAALDSTNISVIDSSHHINIKSITITGNKKTKRYIIEREIPFKVDDCVPSKDIEKKIMYTQQLIYNTKLFESVIVNTKLENPDSLTVQVIVKEKWYIYPFPKFQLIDRSFNEWIKVYKADLQRVIYGAKFAYYNIGGRRDVLRLDFLMGHSRVVNLSYVSPYSNRALTEGFGVSANFSQSKELIYNTSLNNKILRYAKPNFSSTSVSLSGSYILRKDFFRSKLFSLTLGQTKVADSIITSQYNPSYFNTNKSRVNYVNLSYLYRYINTNNVNYPLSGLTYYYSVSKRGIGFSGGINMISLDGNINKYISHGNNLYTVLQAHANLKLPFKQPYINKRQLGYGSLYLRGLEGYVIDGVAMGMARYMLKKKAFNFDIKFPIKNKYVQKIPFTIFPKLYADLGYVYNNAPFVPKLNNKPLYSGGFGVDILTFYDFSFNIEYSLNQLGEKGLFLRLEGGF